MTIDEAIKHELDMAERHEHCESVEAPTSVIDLHKRYAEEHRQVAEWLTDYKNLLGAIEDIKLEIKECKYGDEEASETDEDRAEAYNFGLEEALEIIDKHTSGKEDV